MNKDLILDLHNFRYSCREFSDQKISDEDFNLILEAGRLSPSSVGLEPWNFIIVQNKDLRNKLIPHCSGGENQLKTASHFVIILARNINDLKYNSEYIEHILKNIKKYPDEIILKYKKFLENFQNIRFNNLKDEKGIFNWSCRQAYIALANMINTSSQLRINSCAIEGFDIESVENLLEEESILDKSHFGIACMVAFGYEKNSQENIKTRQKLDEITKWII